MSKRILLTQGKVALVDDEDYEWLNQWKWYAIKRGNIFYAARYIGKWPKQRTILMHREILNVPKGAEIDHINCKGLNNRKSNLRICTHQQNTQNQRKPKYKSSKYKGVHWSRIAKKWAATIRHNNKGIHLGYFVNQIEAAKTYNKKAKALFGEFARLNNV